MATLSTTKVKPQQRGKKAGREIKKRLRRGATPISLFVRGIISAENYWRVTHQVL